MEMNSIEIVKLFPCKGSIEALTCMMPHIVCYSTGYWKRYFFHNPAPSLFIYPVCTMILLLLCFTANDAFVKMFINGISISTIITDFMDGMCVLSIITLLGNDGAVWFHIECYVGTDPYSSASLALRAPGECARIIYVSSAMTCPA